MPRIVKEEEFAIRRNEILDVVQHLVFTKGYEQMSIQDILDEMHISKGAFYHYYASKPALLEALTQRVEQEAFQQLTPIIQDQGLSGLAKLERFFDTTARWKTAHKTYLLALLSVWYHDDNAIVRHKMVDRGFRRIMPMIAEAIRQGVREGLMQMNYTDPVGEVLMSLFLGMGDATAKQLLELAPDSSEDEREACFKRIVGSVQSYTLAVERVLGAAPGSLKFFDVALLREWVVTPAETLEEEPALEKERQL